MATKKATAKKTTKKTAVRKSVRPTKKTAAKKQKYEGNAYFWGGLAIALCAAGAFIVLALGVGSMIRH